jgi:hypothetical protein
MEHFKRSHRIFRIMKYIRENTEEKWPASGENIELQTSRKRNICADKQISYFDEIVSRMCVILKLFSFRLFGCILKKLMDCIF